MIPPASLIDATVNCRHGAAFFAISSKVMMDIAAPAPASTPAKAERVLVLQGGGALGSYQAGAFQALCPQGFEPEWNAGISIGAINAATSAGKPPQQRIPRAKAFWELWWAPVPRPLPIGGPPAAGAWDAIRRNSSVPGEKLAGSAEYAGNQQCNVSR